MGNQGKMAGNSKICIGIQSQLILPEFIYIYHVLFEKCNLWAESALHNSPRSVFRKPQLFHTFSVILILSNYRKWKEKSRFSSNWSRTFLATQIYCFELVNKFILFKEKASNVWIQEELAGFECQYKSLNFSPSCPDYP